MAISLSEKDIPNKKIYLGQFLTPGDVVNFCLSKTEINTGVVVEPSCGKGDFLDKVRKKVKPETKIFGIEIDPEVAGQYNGSENVIISNFYDCSLFFDQNVTFIGNPPYRTPAFSLTDRRQYIKGLMKKYHITNMREESVFFIVKTVDLIIESGVKGYINYILPKAIFQNNSKAYKSFIAFLKKYLKVVAVWDILQQFIGVNRDLVYVCFETKSSAEPEQESFLLNDIPTHIDQLYQINIDYIPFQQIFKKTYLGSVPCESIFLSVHDEPLINFQQRLQRLFSVELTKDNLIFHLSYNGCPHLTSLKNGNLDKVRVVLGYISEIKQHPDFNPSIFDNLDFYKTIQHRHDLRYYFRHEFLKKMSFVYEINPNPTASFYFTGNPSKGSTDYFGYCDYDVNRNSSPGACRTIPIDTINENVHNEFKKFWNTNTDLPLYIIFEYILFISKSGWYKQMKSSQGRFYFGIPKEFDKTFLETIGQPLF
jgi:hypothetical protein